MAHTTSFNSESRTLVSTRDVAKMLGVSRTTVHRMVERGDLQAVRVGPKLLRFSAAHVLEVAGLAEERERPAA